MGLRSRRYIAVVHYSGQNRYSLLARRAGLRALRCLAVVLCVLAPGAASRAQEWPRFRGPNGSGVSETILPTTWTHRDYRWQIKLPGPGHSSPVVWGERVFVTSADTAGKLHVLCLDAATGATVWTRPFAAGPPRGHKDNNLASSTPAVDGQRVYVAWANAKGATLTALTLDGKDIWQRDLGPYRAGHGFASSPIVHEGRVFLACEQDGNDCITAVDAATGKDSWRTLRKSRNTYASPCVFQSPSRAAELIAVSYEDGITSIDPATGRYNWSTDPFDKRHIESAIASPIVVGELILGSAGWLSERYESIAVRPGNAPHKVDTAFKLDRDVPLVPTPVAKDGLVFLWSDRGIASCYSATTGERYWRERVEGSFYASPVIAGKYLYCPSREGDMIVLAADRKFEHVASVPLGEGTHSTPAIAGGRMFLRTATELRCLQGVRPQR
jgi:outer membrane protein assembly factor BamB